MSVPAYPLHWPTNRPRRAPHDQKYGRFSTKQNNGRYLSTKDITTSQALHRLQDELDRIGAELPVVSSNVQTRLDGLPRSGQREPDDPGVAVYFQLGGRPHCLPCDTYTQVAQNIAAVAAHIEATRKIERHGVASVQEMFTGFEALPAPGQAASQQWWVVLGVPTRANHAEISAAYRRLAAERHPDQPGGSNELMAELNAARDEALRSVV